MAGPRGAELSVDPVQGTKGLGISERWWADFAPHHAAQPNTAHQTPVRTASHDNFSTRKMPLRLASTVDLHVDLTDALNMRHQHLVATGPDKHRLRG